MQEIITGERPYAKFKYDLQVVAVISKQYLPSKPLFSGSLSDVDFSLKQRMWSICELCWNIDPQARPSMSVLLGEMEGDRYRSLIMPCFSSQTLD